MTRGEPRRKSIAYMFYDSPQGELLVLGYYPLFENVPPFLCGLYLVINHNRQEVLEIAQNYFKEYRFIEAPEVFELSAHLFDNDHPGFFYPLKIETKATEFQFKVLEMVREIPIGQTRSYQDIANAIGKPKAVRAVANAVANNPLSLIVPCHRVIRSDGSIGGYRWGLDKKRELLAREKILARQLIQSLTPKREDLAQS